MPIENETSLTFDGVAPGGVISPEMRSKGYDFFMARGAGDFFMTAHTRTGHKIPLSESISSMSFDESLEDVVTSGSVDLDNSIDTNGRRLSQFIGKGTLLVTHVRNPVTGRIEERDRFVVWTRRRAQDGILRIEFYDYMKYLADSKVTVLYTKGTRKRHWNAGEITKHLCRQYGIKLARIPRRCMLEVPYFYQEEEPLLDILIRLWTMEAKKSNRRFILKMVRGRLHVITKPKNPTAKVIEISNGGNDAGILSSISVTDSIEGVATVVRLWGTAKDFADGTPDTRRAVVKSNQYASKTGVATWGRIYLEKPVEGVITKPEINKRAKALLKQTAKSKFEVDVEIVGYPYLRAGSAVRLHEPQAGASGLFWFKTLSHSMSGDGKYVAKGTLTKYEYTKTLAADPDDLKADAVALDGASGTGSVSALTKTNGIPTDVWNTIRAASAKAGVPQAWANSKAMQRLIQSESGFNWTAQNPSSTAYGMFQFLDSTWDDWDTGVTKKQATPGYTSGGKTTISVEGVGSVALWKYNMTVAGLRYIKKRFGNPEKAWAFKQAHNWY